MCFYSGKNALSTFAFPVICQKICVATKELCVFRVCSFGCTLFLFGAGKRMESIQEINETRKPTRNSGIELVKVIAILLIVCSHVVQTLGGGNSDYTIDLSTATTDWVRLLITMFRYSGALGNTLFFVCSAWFLLDSKQVSGQKIMLFASY